MTKQKIKDMRIQVTKDIDKHTREAWLFNMFDLTTVFIGYRLEEKPPRKRLWTALKVWDKYSDRHFNRIEEPILDDTIREEAYKKVCEYIKVKTWAEWK